ncbi:MAG: thiamine phosphate synthase [Clostridiales bacterium]|nr:thiamine phosphate synthase [Clostridiales bacterium]
MLQFTITPDSHMTMQEQAKMAIDCHCAWIEVDPAYTDPATLDDIIRMCRENEIILLVRHDVEKLEETRVHGVHLGTESSITPSEVRTRLGGHPIVGVGVTQDTPLIPLKRADVDYVVMYGYPEITNCESVKALYQVMCEQDSVMPIVVEGRMTTDDIRPLIEAGASGINIDINSLSGPEYKISLAGFLDACREITMM